MKVQFIVSKGSGIGFHRIINPMDLMPWEENDTPELLFLGEDEHKVDADILLYSKYTNLTKSELLVLKKKGTKIVVDVDDDWELPVNHPFYQLYTSRNGEKRTVENLELADLVICTTIKLQEKVRKINKNTVVIPNALPFERLNYLPLPNADKVQDKMGFIYVAGSTHLADVELLRGKFKRIGSDAYLKQNALFMLAGYNETKKAVYDTKKDFEMKTQNFKMVKVRDVWDSMSSIFAETGSYKILPSLPLDTYIDYYDVANVAIVPLVNSTWNSYKSELKIIEAGCKALPVICSNVEPYSTLKQDNKNGILWVDTPDDWIKHIKYCTKNPSFVKEQGLSLAEYVRSKFDLIQWNTTRMDIFKHLLKK